MFVLIKQTSITRHSRESGNPLAFNISTRQKWIPAFVPQGYTDLLSAKALAKSYAGTTK